jgi:hypothetical protein
MLTGMLLVLVFAVTPTRGDNEMTLKAVIADADITYRTTFRLPCTDATWQVMAADPLLFADLWNAYGYGPAYSVRAEGAVLHVSDPTGLAGKVAIVEASPRRRRYLVEGEVDHWAVPFMNEGTAVFVLDTVVDAEGVAGELIVSVQAGSAIAGFVLRLTRSVLLAHVANRIELNLQDASTLLQLIERQPEMVQRKVSPALWARLRGALSTTD